MIGPVSLNRKVTGSYLASVSVSRDSATKGTEIVAEQPKLNGTDREAVRPRMF